MTAIARELPRAIADQGDRKQGIEQVAASMQNFLTSDVIYQTRFAPSLRGALDDEGLGGEQVPRSRFLPEPDWVLPATVGERIPKLGGSGADDKEAAPGLHGTGRRLRHARRPGADPRRRRPQHLPLRRPDDDGPGRQPGREHRGGRPRGGHDRPGRRRVRAEKTLDTIAAGETKPVEIPITDQPPTGQNVPINVTVAKVPGEEKLDNNKASLLRDLHRE